MPTLSISTVLLSRDASERALSLSRRIRVARGDALYKHGDRVEGLVYEVRFGAFKTCRTGYNGAPSITGFQMQRDLLGLEALGLPLHRCDTIALEDSEVWELPVRLPMVRRALHRRLSGAVAQTSDLALMLRGSSAEQRLAAFLLHQASRYAAAGYSAHCFRLRMARVEIAGFLGLTAESVSRILRRWNAAGVIDVQRRLVTLCDAGQLQRIAGVERSAIAYVGAGDHSGAP